jgi:putative ABC transport system substrate-binding protein
VFEIRSAQGVRAEEAFPHLGAELVKLGVDMIVSVTGIGLVEAKRAMATVPVVMAVSEHPVERGLIASLARPGGNITGLATFTDEMFSKRVQILAEALPGVSRVAVLRLPGTVNDLIVRDLETAAQRVGMKLQVIEVHGAEDVPAAFLRAVRGRAQAIMTTQGPFFFQYRREIADLALKHKLPSFSGEPTAADAGMLMTHGPSIPASCQRAAAFVDKILKGGKPADIPVEQPTKVEFAINLKTAKTLGLTIPPSLLLQAHQVLE